jgi:hypothetical protein
VGRGGKAKVVAVNLERRNVVEEGEDNISSKTREGRMGQVAPGPRPWDGEGGSKFFVEGLGGDLPEAFDSNSREAKDLDQEGGEVPVHGGRDILCVQAITKEEDVGLQVETNPES